MRVREKTATLEGVMTRIVPPPLPPPLDSNLSMKEFITFFEVTKRQSRLFPNFQITACFWLKVSLLTYLIVVKCCCRLNAYGHY